MAAIMFSKILPNWLIVFVCVIIPSALLDLEPRVIVDLTDDIDQFQNTSDHKSRENIETALSYSLNLQYRTSKPLKLIPETLQNLSMLIDAVCKGSKTVQCEINQINLYFHYEGSIVHENGNVHHLSNKNLEASHPQFRSYVYIVKDGLHKIEWESEFTYMEHEFEYSNEFLQNGFFMSHDIYKKFEKLTPLRLMQFVNKYIRRLFISVPLKYPEGVPESFSLFLDSFSDIFNLLKKIKTILQDGAWTEFYLAISLNYSRTDVNEPGKTIQNEYQHLILKFVNELVQEQNISVVISGVTIPSNFTTNDFVPELVIGRDVHPVTKFEPSSPVEVDLYHKQLTINGEFAPAFKTILMEGFYHVREYMKNRADMNLTVPNPVSNKTTFVLIRDNYATHYTLESLNKLLTSNQSLPRKIGMEIQTVFFGENVFKSFSPLVSKLLEDSRVNLGYAEDFGILENYAKGFNSTLFKNIPDNVDAVLFTFILNLTPFVETPGVTASHIRYLQNIQSPLAVVYQAWKNHEATSSRRQALIVDLKLLLFHYINSPLCGHKAYCNSCISKTNEVLEAILTWGKIHKVNIVINNLVVHRPPSTGWYDYIAGVNDPLEIFLPRCQPLRLLNLENACIDQTQGVPPLGIQFNSHLHGITINSRVPNAQRLSGELKELQTMTEFALNRFNLIEILLVSDEQCTAASTIKKLLQSETFESKLELGLYLDFSLQPVDNVSLSAQIECIKKLSAIVGNAVDFQILEAGIHLSNWEVVDNINNKFFDTLRQIKHSKTSIGLTVRKCGTFGSKLDKTCEQTLKSVDYVVCLTEQMEASNKNLKQMSNHLDANLYVSKLFNLRCQKLQVYFRLSSFRKSKRFTDAAASEFLTFIEDWVQFSVKYQIPLFLTEVFDRPDDDTNGWWRLSNQTDFANPDVYIEKEAEYFDKLIWKPKSKKPELKSGPNQGSSSDSQQVSLTTLMTVSLGIVSLAAVIILRIWVKYLRTKQRLVLSKEKVKEILDGESQQVETSSDLDFQPNFKYDPKYEIVQSSFDFLEASLIGSGYFGKVYKVQLENEFVAVKRPNPACPEQGLISMLEEIKILCHVGDHEHVLRFIGCSTKSACKGQIYIATELCENGCLQMYLTNLNSEVKPDVDNKMTLYLLNQFSFEIASGMEYIASRRIIHSDLATRNVLLDSNLTCKIGDFGLSRKLYASDLYEKQGHDPMPWRWMAIESLRGREYSTASDVWSYGVTIWEVFSLGGFPYAETSSVVGFIDQLENGLRLAKPVHMSDITFEKITRCWELETCSRPNFTNLKQYFQLVPNEVYTDL